VARRPSSFVADTDIFIDYLNGIERMRMVLDSPRNRVYYSAVTRKELLAKPGLSSTERHRIQMLLLKHRLISVDQRIAERFSRLLNKYARHGLRRLGRLAQTNDLVQALAHLRKQGIGQRTEQVAFGSA